MTRLCIVTKSTLHQDCNVVFSFKRGESSKRDVLMGGGIEGLEINLAPGQLPRTHKADTR